MKVKIGDFVDYHSIIGREVTSTGHMVTAVYPLPNNFGCECAMITSHCGVVAVAALTKCKTQKKGQTATP